MSEKKPKVRLVVQRDPDSVPANERGRLLEAHEVASEIFRDKVKTRWVLQNIPHRFRHKIGRTVLYYENDVRLYIETQREQDAA